MREIFYIMKKRYRITIEGKTYDVEVEPISEQASTLTQGGSKMAVQPSPVTQPVSAYAAPTAPSSIPPQTTPLVKPAPKLTPPVSGGSGLVRAPMPCSILSVRCKAGDAVNQGEVLLSIEAMKMEQDIYAPITGKVKEVSVAAGVSVKHGDVLVLIEPN